MSRPDHPLIMEDLLQIRMPLVNFHVLRDRAGLYLIDTGFIGAEKLLEKALAAKGWEKERIVGVILTHGHLDHILNVARIARKHQAWIAAPRLDAPHYAGRAVYRGWSRVAGWLEAIGKPLLGFGPFTPDRWIDDGDFIDVWHGLEAVHLPGHTPGHTGYFCRKLGLLFCGDLFASHGWFTRFPPVFFNTDGEMISSSVTKALELPLAGVLPNHGSVSPPEIHLGRLRNLQTKK